MKKSFLKTAYVSRVHGLKGGLFLFPFNPRAKWPSHIESLKINESLFQVEQFSAHKNGFIVKLKGCDSKSSAEKFQFQPVFLDKKLFESKEKDSFYLAELLDFVVEIEGQKGKGFVLYFESDKKNQDFLVIEFFNSVKKKGIYSIPLASAYIKTIDFKNKRLILKLPDQFLEIFKDNRLREKKRSEA